MRAAGFVKGGEPAAEVGCIVLPGGAGGGAQKLGGVGAEQLVGLHGEVGEAIAGAFEEGCQAVVGCGEGGPDGLPLCGVEEQAGIGGAVSPCGAEESVPVLNAGGGPGFEALGLAGAIEGGSKGAGGVRSLAVTTLPPWRSHGSFSTGCGSPFRGLYAAGVGEGYLIGGGWFRVRADGKRWRG